MSNDLSQQAFAAYLYGFPLVFNLDQVVRYTTVGIGSNPPAEFNEFSHSRTLATAHDTFVSINNDTVYSIAQIDLSAGPVRLTVPASDRYYVLQFVDAWTNNFAYLGERATGRGAGSYLIVPPGWSDSGVSGSAEIVIHAPTMVISIVGRWACSGNDDLAAVHILQDGLTLTQVNPATPNGLPIPNSQGSDVLDFWEKYRIWSQVFSPASRDEPLQTALAPLGLTGNQQVHMLSDEQKQALSDGHATGEQALDRLVSGGASAVVNGWSMALHLFDYNLDFFEIGTLDDPAWKITDPKDRIAERAVAAKAGLWGNHGYEAAYAMTHVDEHGAPLTGEHDYRLTLSPPPVRAFWSVTMYALPDYYLVDNPVDRYSIGDRTAGLERNPDGSLTIHLSRTAPADPAARANWLPTPPGRFRPILRMYSPTEAILNGDYAPAAIRRID